MIETDRRKDCTKDEDARRLHEARRAFAAAGRTLRNVCGDFSAWHLGRPYFALWALDVDTPPVRTRVAAAASHLDGLLLQDYRRQPHVTLGLCGFPQSAACDGGHPDAFRPGQLRRQIDMLRRTRPGVFDIAVGALASFTSAPFLTVRDSDGGIGVLRGILGDSGIDRPHGAYVPHVTVGLYCGAWPIGAVGERLDGFDDDAPLICRIERASLMCYASEDVGGVLYHVADVDLRSGEIRCAASRPVMRDSAWQPLLEDLC